MPEFNRRDLLKFFGIGATVVPVVGGVPKVEAPARLIAEPKVEPLEVVPADVKVEDFARNIGYQKTHLTVFARTEKGQTYRFDADTFVVNAELEVLGYQDPEVIRSGLGYMKLAPGRVRVGWKMTGECTGPATIQDISRLFPGNA